MAWRTVLITTKGHASVKRSQLCLERDEGNVSIPIEDIALVLLENRHITLSTALLSKLCEAGASIAVCDERHMPNGLMLPFHAHSRQSQIGPMQVAWTAPFRKRCWQHLVKRKIKNQAHHLVRFDQQTSKALIAIADHVDSGDSKNREAHAARAYWSALMDKGFVRGGPDLSNAALNYGYTVVRACVARAVVGAGLLPCFGLHHDNNLNGFNLVDDLIEPFRPIVDEAVIELKKDREQADQLTKDDRAFLAGLPAKQIQIKGEVQTLLNGAEVCAESLVRAIREKDTALLELPEFAL